MANFQLEYNLGLDKDVYERLVASLPPGKDNMVDDIVIPAHPASRPVPLLISNVTPNVPHILHVQAEFGSAPTPNLGFVPSSTTISLSIALAYGPNILTVTDNLGKEARFRAVVTNYALLFRAEAAEITAKSWIPIKTLEANIESDVGYILANPLIADVNRFIPTDLDILGVLANKLLVKNLLWRPGRDGGIRELFAAFGASNPVIHPMHNLGRPETPLYRTDEHFAGYEAHCWLPNREVERWRTFIQFISNLPQLYTLQQINEGEIYLTKGGRLHRHIFDFESDFANTVLEGTTADQCFQRLFRLDMTIDSEMFITFCQASYPFDTSHQGMFTPDADLLGVTNFTDWSLSGRFEQQFDISFGQHLWIFDSPVDGVVDGVNRFFTLSETPPSREGVKVYLDGLLMRYLVDYRISSSFFAGSYSLPASIDSMLINIPFSTPRALLAPVFTSVEIYGGADTEFFVTAVDQSLNDVNFIISQPPEMSGSPEEARLHYTTPVQASIAYGGDNQYGTETLPIGITSYSLVFPTPAVDIDYQLVVQYAEDPAGAPSSVGQIYYIVRNHTLTGATIEFGEAISSPNAKLHWWLVEEDFVVDERGTVNVPSGASSVNVPFTGAYADSITVIIQLWNTTAFSGVSMPLVSFTNLTGVSAKVQFSDPIPDGNYRVDYLIFRNAAVDANQIEIFSPPQIPQVVEAHYDVAWEHWVNAGPVQQPDGLSTVFYLPKPCPIPQALYVALDGRLLRQGYNEQYTVEAPDRIRLTFVPEPGQFLWFVYPVADLSGNIPTSVWSQGLLVRQGDNPGRYATGSITNSNEIAPGDTVELFGITLTATATAKGMIVAPVTISPSDSITFQELGVTLVGVAYTLYSPPAVVGTLTNATINDTTNTFTVGAHGLLNNTRVYFRTTGTVPGGLSPLTRYYIINATQNTFQLSATFNGSAIDITSQGTGTQTLYQGALPTEFASGKSRDEDAAALTAVINTFEPLSSVFYAVYFNNGEIEVRAKYLTTTASNQTLVVIGQSLTSSNIVGDSAPLPNLFPAGISKALDSTALRTAIQTNINLDAVLNVTSAEGVVYLTSKVLGSQGNDEITLTGFSMATTHLTGGVDPQTNLPMVTPKIFYNYEAPIVALDGVSNSRYDTYSGNRVQFKSKPVPAQIPYAISQVFPVEQHPLDSMAANEPCAYPRGVFTQGLACHLTDSEIEVDQDGDLVIVLDNLPIQEEPTGAVDNVNTIYDMSLESCAGTDSLMVWIDGIYQPPTTYAYSVFAGHGRITLSAPLVTHPVPQKIWVWYMALGDACAEEHTVSLTGTKDGVNQTFGIPDSPFLDKPSFVMFLEGLFQLQGTDYLVDVGNTSVTYQGTLAPAAGQSLYGHFNNGNITLLEWRQIQVGVGDGTTSSFTIPTLNSTELPTSQDSVILAFDGLVQRQGIDFTVNLDFTSFPDGTLTFSVPPEAGRKIQVAYIKRG